MAVSVLLPRQGQTVESCIIAAWKKQVGDAVAVGDILVEVETDKAMLEVESTAEGVLLAQFFQPGDEVPVLTAIAAVGQAGERAAGLSPHAGADAGADANAASAAVAASNPEDAPETAQPAKATPPAPAAPAAGVSPRARALAAKQGIDASTLQGSGPRGRVIARDIAHGITNVHQTASAITQELPALRPTNLTTEAAPPKLTPLAAAMVNSGDYVAPPSGTGRQGKVMRRDLQTPQAEGSSAHPGAVAAAGADAGEFAFAPAPDDDVTVVPVRGVRRVIAERMLASLQTTAQLTMSASADARQMQAYRQRLKDSAEPLGLRRITLNDLILFAVARTLPTFPELNAVFDTTGGRVIQYHQVHLGFAVDTPRGLVVPVLRDAHRLGLKALADEGARLAAIAQEGRLPPDAMQGGTFTVTNLGSFGIEHFTPILNPPQVAILGVGNIQLKPVQAEDGAVVFIPHIGLSLTINHQIIDGAPAARFLQTLGRSIASFELLLAL